MNRIYIFLISILFLISIGIQAQIQQTVSFDRNDLEVTYRMVDGVNYTVVNYKDGMADDKEGYPDLPYRYLNFIVPDDANNFTVETTSLESSIILLDDKVLPTRVLANGPNVVKNLFEGLNSTIYNSVLKFPIELSTIDNDGYFDGDKRILTLKISPTQYISAENKLIFHSKIQIKIGPNNANGKRILPIYPSKRSNGTEMMQSLSFVSNKEDIPIYGTQRITTSEMNLFSSSVNLPNCEYLIVTSEKYIPTLERLISWRRLRGISTDVVTMGSILNMPSIIGDTISGIYDNAGKLRQYLTCAYKNGTKYVLIVGKDMPFRYGTGFRNSWGSANEDKIPSDLYFCDLNGNWNVDKDQYYGEPVEDKVDFMPELYVGRLTCNNIDDLNNYIDKLFCYERNPGDGNSDYLNKALYVHADHLQEYGYVNDFSNKMKPYFTKTTILGELPGPYETTGTYFPKGSDVIKEMNNNYGLVSFYIHGWDDLISTMTNNKPIPNQTEIKEWVDGIAYRDSYHRECIIEDGNGVDCLTNWNKPFIVYSVSCTTMPFDILSDIPHNIGEAFTLAGKYGAVAYLGNTRSGYGRCFDLEFANMLSSSEYRLGVMEAKSKSKGGSHYNLLSHNLLGCPLIPMWTNIPSSLSSVTMSKSNNSLTVNTQYDDCEIVIAGLLGNSRNIQKDMGRTCQFNNVPKNYAVTVYKHNYLPYIAPIYLQNEEVIGKHYLIGDKIFMGNNVDNTKPNGDFIIKSNADVTIEASDCIEFNGGFTVEAGAYFEIRNNK